MSDTFDHPRETDTLLNRPIDEESMLLVLTGTNVGTRIPITPDMERITIGRDEDADLVLADDSISRKHCVISFEGERWFIEDLKSTNGTYVAHQFIDRVPLENGDLIAVGRTIFRFFFTLEVETYYREEIHRLAIIDSLTQIHNRRYLLDFIGREISRCRRRGHPMSMILFEVAGFTSINQRYGHLSGDHVLREVAGRLVRRVRREELIARSNENQFAIILPETMMDEAHKFAEIIEHTIAVMDVKFDGWTIPVSIRASVCQLSDEIATPSEFIAKGEVELMALMPESGG